MRSKQFGLLSEHKIGANGDRNVRSVYNGFIVSKTRRDPSSGLGVSGQLSSEPRRPLALNFVVEGNEDCHPGRCSLSQ